MMFQTVIMPILVGLAFLIMAILSTKTIMPLVQLDDFYKEIITIAIWVMSFVLPMEYSHKKAKKTKKENVRKSK